MPACLPRVSHRQRDGRPTLRLRELHDRWGERGLREDLGGRAIEGRAVATEEHDTIAVMDHTFEAVLRDDDGHAQVVDQSSHRRENVFGRGRVERRGRLVEHEHSRLRGEHRADRDPLLLAAREVAQRTRAQVGDAEQVEGLLDPLAHHVGRQAQLLHRVGELLFDGVGDEARERILSHVPDDLGHVPGLVLSRVTAVDRDATYKMASGEVGDESVDRAEQRRLARSCRTDDEAELALVDRQIDVPKHGAVASRVGERVDVESDHDPTSTGARRRDESGGVATRAASGIARGDEPWWRCDPGGQRAHQDRHERQGLQRRPLQWLQRRVEVVGVDVPREEEAGRDCDA